MNKPIHPAVAEHVMQENQILRGLFAGIRQSIADHWKPTSQRAGEAKHDVVKRIDAALSQQAEPVCEIMQRPKVECGCPDCGSSLIDWPKAEPAPAQSETNDQIAAVMLQHGTPEQQAEALRYAGLPAPAQTELVKALRQAADALREAGDFRSAALADKALAEFEAWWNRQPHRDQFEDVKDQMRNVWVASRREAVIELPKPMKAPPYASYEGGWNDSLLEAKDAIESAGLTVKE